jgi:hypothetical protein
LGWISYIGDIDMPLPDANNYSTRIYELLKETDLQNLSYAQFQGVAESLFIEPENEDEMRRLVLVQLARMAVRGDWDGFLSGGGSSAVTSLVAGTNITLSPITGLGDVTINAASGAGIGGTITNDQVARGATTSDEIEGSNGLLFDGTSLTVNTLTASDPVLNLASSTKSVSLEVNTSQKLSVKGASNSFVFDASSATGGITFPDSTVQITAASGGGSGVNPLSFTSSQGLAVTAYWLLGLNPTVSTAMENEAFTTGTTGFVVKFQPPMTGTSGITMGISVIAAADTNYLWVYDESAKGWAGTFVAKIKMPTTTTGLQTETQWLDAAGSNITSPTFTQGNTYIAVMEVASQFSAASGRQANLPFVVLANDAAFTTPSSEFYNYQYTGTIDASLPTTDINFFASSVGWPMIGLAL